MQSRRVVPVVGAVLLVAVVACGKKGPTAPTPTQVFHDDFGGTALDASAWSVDPGDGTVVVANGVATLSCSGNTFPVVTTRENPFPSGNFLVRVRLRYASVAHCGSGFGAMDNFWENYSNGTACRPFLVWQDAYGWYVYTGSSGYTPLTPAPTTDYHIYEIRYVGGAYSFSLDGTVVASGSCAPKATRLFFGHPHPVACGAWTSFEIDYVHIEPLG